MLGRVKPPGGVDPLGVDPLDVDPLDVDPGVEPDEPDPVRRRPNSEPVTLAGTPWLSRHWVYLARAAGVEPEVASDPVPDGEGAVVVGEAVALLEPPPQPMSSPARARRGKMITVP
jgi:hypothetical protein